MRHGHSKLRMQFRPTMLAMVDRGGRVRPRNISSRGARDIKKAVKAHVMPHSVLYTDEWSAYLRVAPDFQGHTRIKHKAKLYAIGDSHTNTVEGFFGLFKNSVRGVYHSVSVEYLQSYLDEYAFRYNHRHSPTPMFWAMLNRVQKTAAPTAP